MGCLTFETAIENRSLSAFCLCVIIGFSPFITLVGVSMFTLFCCLFPKNAKSEYTYRQIYLCLSDHHLLLFLRTVRLFSCADDKIIIFSSHFLCFVFPAQVVMGMESISDVIESQSIGLKKVSSSFTSSLIASLIRFN